MDCFWTWQNGVFWVCFFWGFNVIVVCFWCVWHSSRSVKNVFFFPVFWAFVGWFILVYFGFGRFRCFCVSCVCFCFLCCFCFCFVCFVFVLLLDCFLVLVLVLLLFVFFMFLLFLCSWFLFLFFFVFFCCFVFLEGLRVWWGGLKGPPHLAQNPPYFLFVFFFFVFVFFLCFPFFVFFNRQKTCFPPKKVFICLFFSVSLCFSLAFFGPPPFLPFIFLCLSLSLSLYLSVSLSLSLSLSLSIITFHCMFALHPCFLVVHVVFLVLVFAILLCFFDFWKPVKNISEKWKLENSKNEKCRFEKKRISFWLKAVSILLCLTNSCSFVLLALLFLFNFAFFETCQKHRWKNGVSAKQQTWKMQKKKRTFWQKMLAQLCSQIVSLFLFCVSFNFSFLLKTTIKVRVSAQKKQQKH